LGKTDRILKNKGRSQDVMFAFSAHPRRFGNTDDSSSLPVRITDMNTKKVLVIDDQRSQLKLMRKMLEKFGYMAVTVESAEEAEYILRCGEKFSIIITDLKMPWLNGLNFCRNVKIFHPNSKIYALSGYLYNFDINELQDAGFDGLYEKPISKEQLIEILNSDTEKT
jgi:CheY-like chemotaxis protein